MFHIFVAAVLASSVLSPHIAQIDVSDVRVGDSIMRYSDAQKEAQSRREEAMEALETKRAEVKDRVEERKQEFQDRLQNIKDERKQRIVANLAERFMHVNEKWTEHWTNMLGRLSEITAKMSGEGVDTEAADAAIASAQEAVETQAGKDYEIEITDENNLREEVQALVAIFKEDMRSTLSSVQNAKKEVQTAFRVYKGSKDSSNDSEVEVENEEK
jgi:hypothetical protein